MSDDHELPSESESDDEDYVPAGQVEVSEEESGSCSDGPDESGGKRKKTSKKKRKKAKIEEIEEEVEEKEDKIETKEELKKKSDALWADFLKEVPTKKKPEVDERISTCPEEKENSQEESQPSKIKVTQVFDFAGEKVQVEKEIDAKSQLAQTSARGRGRGRGRGGGGIASLLGQIGKKGKLSTLEKSKLDWDKFKKDEGIDEQLEIHNKGKNGYLERQDFLQRTDLRQFEIEKDMRASKRPFNR